MRNTITLGNLLQKIECTENENIVISAIVKYTDLIKSDDFNLSYELPDTIETYQQVCAALLTDMFTLIETAKGGN